MTVKDLRLKTGLTQTEFAKILNMSVRTVQSWERGARRPPQYVLFLIDKVLRYEGMYEK